MKLKSISPQWEAKGGKIRPVNPYDFYENEDTPTRACENAEHNKFERKYAKLHTYDTDLPDRIYNAEELNEPVWQAYNEESRSWEDIFPANYEICEAIDKGFKEYKADALKLFNMETRQFVPGLKQQ